MKRHTSGKRNSIFGRGNPLTAGAGRLVLAEWLEPRRLLSTITVTTLSDTAPGAPISSSVSLRQAVEKADANHGSDSIVFASSLFAATGLKTLTLTNGEIVITDTVGTTTITGPGAGKLAVSGNKSSRIFDIAPSVTAVVSQLTLTNGLGKLGPDGRLDGGAILNQGRLTIASSTIKSSNAAPSSSAGSAAHGGGIFSSGSLMLQGDTFTNNEAFGGSGGFGGTGGAIYATGTVTLVSSTLTGNLAGGSTATSGVTAGTGLGGAVYDRGPLSVTGCTLSGNVAYGGYGTTEGYGETAWGGAIFGASSVNLTSSTVTTNAAYGGAGYHAGGAYGGGVFALGTLTIAKSTISGNGIFGGSLGYGKGPHTDGGGIDANGDLSLVDSTVSGNIADGANANFNSAIDTVSGYARGGGVFAAKTATVTASTVSGNSVTGGVGNDVHSCSPGPGGDGEGGGLWLTTGVVTDSTISGNTATGGAGGASGDSTGGFAGKGYPAAGGGSGVGGGIFSALSLKVYDSTLSGNAATGGKGGATHDSYPAGPSGAAAGGGIQVNGGTALLDNTIVSANHAAGVFNDIGGAVISTSSNNLIGVGGGLANGSHGNKVGITNPVLSPLGNFGGTTQTMIPILGSPALGAGSVSLIASGLTTDQRGYAREVGGKVDIGAVEIQKSAPFKGTPAPFGLIQAENFDLGGPGAGYYNPLNVNKGGVYRPTEGASIIPIPAASGGGFALGYTLPTEYFNYTVSVAATGTYTLEFRTAFQGIGGKFHLNIDGVNVTGELTVPGTGNYNTYVVLSKTGVKISAGTHVVQLVIDTAGAGVSYAGNFDWIQAVKTG